MINSTPSFAAKHPRTQAGAGFTLIELLVVIAIIGLLASVILVSLNTARGRARDSKRIADINQLNKALELYFSDVNSYPTASSGASVSTNLAVLVPKYMSTMPKAPTPQDGSCTAGPGNGTNDYYYYANVSGAQTVTSTYVITFCLGSQTGSLSAGSHTLTQAGLQ